MTVAFWRLVGKNLSPFKAVKAWLSLLKTFHPRGWLARAGNGYREKKIETGISAIHV
jgi:hypothetical protein